MSENNSGSMMAGFLVGAAVGAGLALIFAPMAGDETRRRLGDGVRKLKDGTTDKLDQVKGAIETRTGDLSAAIDAGKDAYRRGAAEKATTVRDHV
ncbi:MAG: YtxH domain-containing protein [Candidatus Eisenbacteria bacterium]